MPRYYFDVHDDLHVIDEDGTDLPDDDAAREYALKAARELTCEQVRHGQFHLKHLIAVRDGTGPLFTVPFCEAVEIVS